MDECRVVVIDDHDMMREGLVLGLEGHDDITVVGSGRTIADYRSSMASWSPTVVVTDYLLPDGHGLEIGRLNSSTRPPVPTILITGLERSSLIHDALAAGCQGLLSKTVTIAALADAVLTVANGGTAFPADELLGLAQRDLSQVGATLTPREREVLELLAEAASAETIAETLVVSINTVRNHIRSILTKLHASSQLEAVITAQRAGLV